MSLPDMNVRQVLASLLGVPTSHINEDVINEISAFGKLMFVDDKTKEYICGIVQRTWEYVNNGSDT